MSTETEEMFAPDPAIQEAEDAAAALAAHPPLGELTETQLEALLFVAERPLTRAEIAQLAGVDREVVDACIGDLHVSLAGRGINLVESGERVELATASEGGRLIARYVGADAPRLSTPSLETLAIVAYRQPCTRATIERIRGVDSDYTLRTLLHRRLVQELGRSEAPGRPILFGTGFDFLERFGLTSLDELPVLDAPVAERLFAEPEETLEVPAEPKAGTTLGLETAAAETPAATPAAAPAAAPAGEGGQVAE
ncbi:MAG TPA: SMC-Scp complex subunit ScpB [Candidatus Limnocylindrales bacterium]